MPPGSARRPQRGRVGVGVRPPPAGVGWGGGRSHAARGCHLHNAYLCARVDIIPIPVSVALPSGTAHLLRLQRQPVLFCQHHR